MSLIKTISDIRNNIAIEASTDLDAIKPDIAEVEEDYIKPALGATTFDNLNTTYNDDPGNLTTEQLALLDLCQKAITNLAYARYIIINRLSINNSGITMIENANTKTAFKYMVNELIWKLERSGFNYIDKTLAYLEEKKATFTDWANSDSYTINKQHFIQTADQFHKHYRINNSRRTFLALEPVMNMVEDFFIEYAITEELSTRLIDDIKAGDGLSSEDQALVDKIQPALAYLTIGHAIDDLLFEVNDNGIQLIEYVTVAQDSPSRKMPPDSTLEKKKKSILDTGHKYLDRLKDFLNKNASETVYPEYYNSDLYVSPDTEVVKRSQTNTNIFSA